MTEDIYTRPEALASDSRDHSIFGRCDNVLVLREELLGMCMLQYSEMSGNDAGIYIQTFLWDIQTEDTAWDEGIARHLN